MRTPEIVRRRTFHLCLGMALVFAALVSKLVAVQALGRAPQAQLMRVAKVLTPPRGAILDRHGSVFATSTSVHCAIINARQVASPTLTADLIAAQLAIPRRDLLRKLKPDLPAAQRPGYVVLKRDVAEQELESIRQHRRLSYGSVGAAAKPADPDRGNPWHGLEIETYSRRQHPLGPLGAQFIGMTSLRTLPELKSRVALDDELLRRSNRIERGESGIERWFDRALAGHPGYIKAETDARGHRIPNGLAETREAVPGHDLVLTIDEQIQRLTEEAVARGREAWSARYMTAIVMQSRSGAILAMATTPGFHPDAYPHDDPNRAVNWATTCVYEPGSTFKIITAAATIETVPNWETLTPVCNGSKQFGKHNVKCWILGKKGRGHGPCSLRTGVRDSCNMAMAEFGARVGREKFLDYVRRFHVGVASDSDSLPGEAAGYVPANPDQVAEVTLAGMAFGQHLSTTPIAMLRAVNVVANDGTLVQPQLVKELRDRDGHVARAFAPRVQTGVIQRKTAQLLRDMMVDVVDNGTGKNARLPGIRVAGKTGTAQKAIARRGYVPGKWVCSFVGFAPADNPELTIIVVANEPKEPSGGRVCAPVFREIAERALTRLRRMPVTVATRAAPQTIR